MVVGEGQIPSGRDCMSKKHVLLLEATELSCMARAPGLQGGD